MTYTLRANINYTTKTYVSRDSVWAMYLREIIYENYIHNGLYSDIHSGWANTESHAEKSWFQQIKKEKKAKTAHILFLKHTLHSIFNNQYQ